MNKCFVILALLATTILIGCAQDNTVPDHLTIHEKNEFSLQSQ